SAQRRSHLGSENVASFLECGSLAPAFTAEYSEVHATTGRQSRPHENGIPCNTVKRRQDRRTPKKCRFHGVLSLHRLSILTVTRHLVSVSNPSSPYVRLHS